MNETAFNLVDEPWIRIMLPDCGVREVSLADALVSAHRFKGLAGEMEAQNVALLRLLIALAHTIFSRVNPDGEEDPVEDKETAMARWKALATRKSFPEGPVRDYLSKWHDRFWLIHPTRPFYQTASAGNGTVNSAAKLNGAVSKSENKERLFASVSGEGKTGMTLSEGARWLLFINGFDDCAAKQKDKSAGSRSMTIAWLGKLGLVTAVGSNLFETILLNMPMLAHGSEIWEEDRPVWELEKVCEEERRTIPIPRDLAGLLTLQSRRVLLKHEGERVTAYGILGGDAFSEQNALLEPMTLWRLIEDKKTGTSFYLPRRHERSRQVWRDFGAMVNAGKNDQPPGVVSWCEILQRSRLIDPGRVITFRVVCVRYDSSQSSSITDSFSDVLSFHADLLLEKDRAWIREINRQVGLIEQAASEIGNLAVNLARACGQGDSSQQNASKAAMEQFYLSVDLPFRDWLLELDPAQDSDEREKRTAEWQAQARRTALFLGQQLVEEKGEAAFIGRNVTVKKKERHYSSPEAYRWFKHHLSSIYPYTQEEGGKQHG